MIFVSIGCRLNAPHPFIRPVSLHVLASGTDPRDERREDDWVAWNTIGDIAAPHHYRE
jgi:hypothetical protein